MASLEKILIEYMPGRLDISIPRSRTATSFGRHLVGSEGRPSIVADYSLSAVNARVKSWSERLSRLDCCDSIFRLNGVKPMCHEQG